MRASAVIVRGSADRPLRLEISRRRDAAGFVTRVLLGEREAVLVPRGRSPVAAGGLPDGLPEAQAWLRCGVTADGLKLLLIAAGCVLLVACANLAKPDARPRVE